MASLLQFDKSIFLFFNSLHASWADIFFFWFTKPWLWIVIGITVGVLLLKKWDKKSILFIFILIAGLVLTDQSCNLLKNNIKRLRPSHDPALVSKVRLVAHSDGMLYKGGKYGFPSGHAATSMFLVLYLSFCISRRRRWLFAVLFGWVMLFSYSRLYLGVHFPLDIICGYILGIFWAGLAYCIWKFLKRQNLH
jgi:undecaprenyl-diphosphatase